MISHKHKCIFVHIPRTGGTSVEKFFEGEFYSEKVTALSWLVVPEVLSVHDVPSEDVIMVPLAQTATYNSSP